MRLALREMRRRPSRFLTATVVLVLIAMLLMLLGGLLDGLINRATSAVGAQRADLFVFSDTADQSFVRSRVTPEQRRQVRAVAGVRSVGGLGVTQLAARVPGNGPRDLADVAIFGYQLPPSGVPEPPGPGKVYADRVLEADGVEVGATLRLGPARSPVEVVGFVDGTSYSGAGALWASPSTWREVQNANRPGSALAPGVFQVLVVQVDGDAATTARRIDAATGGSTESVSKDAAVNAIGGVRQQRSVFNQIIGVTLVIAVVVVALFFALLTVERVGLYGMLKAIGARSRTLFGGVLLQALIVSAIAAAVGSLFAIVFDLVLPPSALPYELVPTRLVVSTVALILAAMVGSAFSLRRVLRVDPASAIGRST
jgi:putative ABC transport system permease protein